MKRNMVAFDCGNSSCRVILGVYDGEQITTGGHFPDTKLSMVRGPSVFLLGYTG